MKNISPKPRLLFMVPLPPPYAGPEVSSALLLKSSLAESFDIIHLKTNVHSQNSQRGRVTLMSIVRLLGLIGQMKWVLLTKHPRCVYTILNQNRTGFIRDAIIVLTAKLFRKKVVLHFRGSNFEEFCKNSSKGFQRFIRFILRRADRIILQAQWVKAKFSQWVPEDRLHVIYNAVGNDIIEAFQPRQVNDGKVKVLFLNHLSVAKGFLDLLEAAKMLVKERKNVVFIMAGDIINKERNILFREDGEAIRFEDVEAKIQSLTVEEKQQIMFPGYITKFSDKVKLYRDADIFVLPSCSEGCPMSVFEAMAMGLPVVVTPVGALVDLIRDEENGKVVGFGKPEDIKDALKALIDDKESRLIMGTRNREMIKQRFTIDTIAKDLEGVFWTCADS